MNKTSEIKQEKFRDYLRRRKFYGFGIWNHPPVVPAT
jgi:hypothetical protein